MPPRTIATERSCLECRRRKIRCDRHFPCSYCTKTRIECAYPPSRRTRPSGDLDPNVLVSRLERIEGRLRVIEEGFSGFSHAAQVNAQAGVHSDTLGSPEITHEPSDVPPQKRANADDGQLLSERGGLRYINHSFWATLGQEVATDRLESVISNNYETQEESTSLFSASAHSPNSLSFVFGSNGTSRTLQSLHPSLGFTFVIWQNYLENVDPLLKIFHTPTVQRLILKAAQDLTNIDPGTEVLMFAIYYATTMSMQPADCQSYFKEDRSDLLARYRFGLEQALSRANFMQSLDLTVLQAFVLYLICGRRDRHGPDVWTLTSLAIRIAVKLGLHRDGTAFSLPPFDIEMRRRLWWQICILDVRTAEDHGTDPCILECSFNTRLPSNLNDSCLDPKMSELPANHPGRTEMLFSLVRFEISYFARRLLFSEKFSRDNSYQSLTSAQKSAAIDELHVKLEKQYLAYCDRDIPFDFITTSSVRLILAKLKIMITRPPDRYLEQEHISTLVIREDLLKTSIEILEYAYALRTSERGREWLWLFQTYVEWDTLAYVLIHLCVHPSAAAAESAWTSVEKVYDEWKNCAQDAKFERRWKYIEKLRSRAIARHNRREAVAEPEQVGDDDVVVESPLEWDPSEQQTPIYSASVAQLNNSEDATRSSSELQQSPHPTATRQPKEATLSKPVSTTATDNRSAVRESSGETIMDSAPSAPVLKNTTSALPASGTACEWSSTTFERYFQGMDWEHGTSTCWL